MSRTWRSLAAGFALAMAMPFVGACDSGEAGTQPTTATAQPITVEVNQSRDQYGKQAIQIQLTNTTGTPPLTVTSARLHSPPLFEGDISWQPSAAALSYHPVSPRAFLLTCLRPPAEDQRVSHWNSRPRSATQRRARSLWRRTPAPQIPPSRPGQERRRAMHCSGSSRGRNHSLGPAT